MRHIDRRFRILLAGPALFVVLGWTTASGQDTRDGVGRLMQLLSADAQIGISIRDVQPDMPEGALVTRVYAGTPAARAGVKEGDVVVEYDRERVRSASQLTRLIRETPAGRRVTMVVLRSGKRVELRVTPEAASSRSFQFDLPMPEFREGPLQPPSRPRVIPEPPWNNWRPYFPPAPRRPLLPGNPRIGIGVEELTSQLAEYFGTKEGVLISTVEDGSPASRAGLKAGDIITSVDGQPVAHTDDVSRALRTKRSGDQVAIGIVRDHKAQVIKVTLGDERPGQPI
jgi:S1-C subfamily serine protease